MNKGRRVVSVRVPESRTGWCLPVICVTSVAERDPHQSAARPKTEAQRAKENKQAMARYYARIHINREIRRQTYWRHRDEYAAAARERMRRIRAAKRSSALPPLGISEAGHNTECANSEKGVSFSTETSDKSLNHQSKITGYGSPEAQNLRATISAK